MDVNAAEAGVTPQASAAAAKAEANTLFNMGRPFLVEIRATATCDAPCSTDYFLIGKERATERILFLFKKMLHASGAGCRLSCTDCKEFRRGIRA
jgi:hypothetical protein